MNNKVLSVCIAAVLSGCVLFDPLDPCIDHVCDPLPDSGISHSAMAMSALTVPAEAGAPDGSVAVTGSTSASAGGSVTSTTASASSSSESLDGAAPSASTSSSASPDASDGAMLTGCDTGCPGAVCDTDSQECVACIHETQPVGGVDPGCDSDLSFCFDGDSNPRCVVCRDDTHCGGDTSVCDADSHACVGCVSHDDCLDPAAPLCDADAKTCVPCAEEDNSFDGSNYACWHLDGDVCHDGSCVQCDDQFASACGDSVCNLKPTDLQFTCTALAPEHSASACEPCSNDVQCQPGQNCVLTTFGSGEDKQDVGWFCLYRVDETLMGDTESIVAQRDELGVRFCEQEALPFISTSDSTSLNGVTGEFCNLSASTCIAINQYRQTPCGPSNPDSDPDWVSECGAPDVDDAVCQDYGSEQRCSPRCLTDDDCVFGPQQRTCDTSTWACSFN